MDREQVLDNQSVIIKDNQIVQLGSADRIEVPGGALVVDGRGKFLMPGLADLHIHLLPNDEQKNAAMLLLYVANGVTTVLNLNGSSHHLELRHRIKSGDLAGPTLLTSGPFISDAPSPPPSADEVESSIIEQKAAGYDLIKIHGDFSRDAYARLFKIARREGMKVIGHAPRNLGVKPMLEEQQDAVAHSEEYLYSYFFYNLDRSIHQSSPEEKARYINEQEKRIPWIAESTAKAGTWVVANLTAYQNIALQVEDLDSVLKRPEIKYMVPQIAPWWQPGRNAYTSRFKRERAVDFHAQYRLLERLTKGFRDSGVRLLAGTDAVNPCVVPGFSIHDELSNLVTAGLTPYEALRTATANAAEFLSSPATGNRPSGATPASITTPLWGTISIGKNADLILVDANPLVDIRNASRRTGVMLRGSWFAENELKAMLDRLAAGSNR
jgi:imidazolonepropionase-like amidohydrolase